MPAPLAPLRPGGAQWHELPAPSGTARVTVVIPAYNYARLLPACVRSVLAQELVDLDVVIVNAASTDDTAAVAARIAAADARVAVIELERNSGHVNTFNAGLGAVTGEYVVLLCADDMLTPGSLARATATMEAHPDVGLVYGHPIVIHGPGGAGARTHGRGMLVWEGPDWISAHCRRGLGCIYSPEACVRASVQRDVGLYCPTLPHACDMEMWFRIACNAGVARVNCDQGYRRIHGGGLMQTTFAGLLADLEGRRDAYEAFFRGAGARLPRARQDLATARRRLAGEALERVCRDLRAGGHDPAEIESYLAFARDMEPLGSRRSWQWREYWALRANGSPSQALRGSYLQYCAARRDLENRYRWSRWRLTGV
jgi:Glycosyl transferase family 2